MYVCICNAMTDRQVGEAIEAGATNWEAVHTYHGYSPNCGKCECEILENIMRRRNPKVSATMVSYRTNTSSEQPLI